MLSRDFGVSGEGRCLSDERNKGEFTKIVREISEGNVINMYHKLSELEDNLLRARAETENVRRRMSTEAEKVKQLAIEGIVGELLPVVDSLEAALGDDSSGQRVKEGVGLTNKQLRSVLSKNSIVAIEPLNQKFNPTFHQAVSVAEAEQDGIVLTVLQKGYTMKGRLLRPALVTVSKRKRS